jgi:hypothetical protein
MIAQQLPLFDETAADLPPTMSELGWECSGRGTYRHASGASFGRRWHWDDEARRLVWQAQVNDGPWEEVSEMFWETLERALSEHGATQ